MSKEGKERMKKIRKKRKIGLFDIFLYIFFVMFSVIVVYPFWDVLVVSFSDPKSSISLGFHIWNDRWVLDSYKYILNEEVFWAYFNTVFRTVVGTFTSLFVTLLCAYPMSKKNLPGRSVLTVFFVFVMFFTGGLIPEYLLIRSLGLLDTRISLILHGLMDVYYMIIMRNYLMSMDEALEEAAFIDGAGYFKILTKVIIPLAKPVIATVALWTAVRHWNSWFHALIYIRDDKKIVLQVMLRRLLEYTQAESEEMARATNVENLKVVSYTVRSAITMVTIGPIILLYPFIQKYFVKGIMIGSLKG